MLRATQRAAGGHANQHEGGEQLRLQDCLHGEPQVPRGHVGPERQDPVVQELPPGEGGPHVEGGQWNDVL